MPVEVPLAPDSAMSREWSVVCLAPDFPAALTAWELPGQQGVPEARRLFESLWTLEPQPVADAARCCARVVQRLGHDTSAVLHDADRLDGTPPADVRHATSVFSRALGYLEAAG
jgi:DICT domain-containing protein